MPGMLGIRARLVIAAFVLTTLAGFLVERLTSSSVERAMIGRVREELGTKLALLIERVDVPSPTADPDWDAVAHRFAEVARVRATLVAPDGRVVGDSGVAKEALSSVENHASRPELVDAKEHGEGTSIRESPTLGPRMIYVARRIDGRSGLGFVRVAVPLGDVDTALAETRRAIALGTGAALALAAVLFGFGAHLLTAPVRRATSAALRMAEGDLSARAPVRGRDEVAMLGRALNDLAAQLSRTIVELRGERDVLSAVLDGMGEGVLLLDDELSIVLANRAMRSIGRFDDEGVGRGVVEVVRAASLREALDEAMVSAAPVVREVEIGAFLPRKLLVRVSRVQKLERGALLAVFHDVTDLRRLETIRTDFVANVSHELRTPVTAIGTAAETLLGGALADPASAREFVEMIERQALRLRRLVDDLLDLAKIEAKEFRFAVRDVELASSVEQTVRLLEAQARARGVSIELSIDKGVPPAHADPRALEQILLNLLDNAIKYGGEGAHVTVAARRAGAKIELSVSDDGPGIAAEHLTRVFERFYRVDARRSRDLGGTGLGLAIVKHLAELMGGTVDVESEAGATTFRVTLPPGARAA